MRTKQAGSHAIVELALKQTVLLLLFGFIVVMAGIRPSFLAWWNIQNILLDVSIYGVVACGMTMLIICGEFDLSASSQYMWAQILFVSLLNATNKPVLSILVTLVSGILLGTINGLIVTKMRVNSFIATLGTMTMIRGLCLVFTGGEMVSTDNAFARNLGQAELLGLSSLTYIYLGVLALVSLVLAYTNFGRRLYATGGNIDVANLAGIKTGFQKIMAFSSMGLLCAIAGIMLVGMLRAGSTQYGTDLALTCVSCNGHRGNPSVRWCRKCNQDSVGDDGNRGPVQGADLSWLAGLLSKPCQRTCADCGHHVRCLHNTPAIDASGTVGGII